jgi:hypothetical protein
MNGVAAVLDKARNASVAFRLWVKDSCISRPTESRSTDSQSPRRRTRKGGGVTLTAACERQRPART